MMENEFVDDIKKIDCVSSVNEAQSTVSVRIGQKTVKLVADFGNLSRLYAAVGESESAVFAKLSGIDYSIYQLTVIFHALIDSEDTRFTVEDLGDYFVKNKMLFDVKQILITVLFLGLIGPKEKSGRGRKK